MAFRKGFISIWYGDAANIPPGWHICDGTADTPDLRDKFIVGAGPGYPPGVSGGAADHTHTFTSNGHTHNIPGGSAIETGLGSNDTTDSEVDTGTTDPATNLPPYYALYYIMKL